MLLNFFAFQKRETSGGTRLRQNPLPPHDDPRGTFLCHGTHVPITQKPPQALSLETVIIVYNRGTTQIDINVHFQCTTMHPSLITGLVPGSSYSFHFRPPSKVHSAIPSILQSHRLQLSVISEEGLLLFLIGFSYFCVCILCHFKANVNPFFDFFQIICQTAPRRRRFLLPWASGWIILGAKGRIFTGRAEHAADLSSHPQFQVHPGHGDPGH